MHTPAEDGCVRVYAIACAGLIAARLLGAQTAVPQGPPPSPCVNNADRHRFDFWIGEWDVLTTQGAKAGQSVVQPIAGGCGLLENWTDLRGGTGKSLNAYNPATRQWQQYWVGQGGAVTEYRESEWRGDTLVYRASGMRPDGKTMLQRLSFNARPDGTVRQFGEISTDGGQSWQVGYEFIYRHRQ